MLGTLSRMIRRLQGVHGETFISFRPWLTCLCQHFKPAHILEFGPGWSTRTSLEHSEATIVSIEESEKWYAKYRDSFPVERVNLLHRTGEWDLNELSAFNPPFDLVFVDGGRRVEELLAVKSLMSERGLVCLHDAHREDYEEGILAYAENFFPERHGCIMSDNAELMAEVRQVVPTDYSCDCKYCSTPARRAYFAKFMPHVDAAVSSAQ